MLRRIFRGSSVVARAFTTATSTTNEVHLVGRLAYDPHIEGAVGATSLGVSTPNAATAWIYLECPKDQAVRLRGGDMVKVTGPLSFDTVTYENAFQTYTIAKVFSDDVRLVEAKAIETHAKLSPRVHQDEKPVLAAYPMASAKEMAAIKKAETLQLWEDFFANPRDWHDNRHNKKNPKQPDFKHKRSNAVLWIETWNRPADLLQRLEDLDS